jgi:CRP-like cAMP-binding protein
MNEKSLQNFINSYWFKDLPDKIVIELAQKSKFHVLKIDEKLIQKGDEGNSMFFLNKGWVKIVHDDVEGEEVVINHLGPGEFVGDQSLMDYQPRSASVVAISPVEAFEIKRDDFLKVLNSYPSVAHSIIRDLSNRLRFTSTYIEKAIRWSRRIIEGDYSMATSEISEERIIDTGETDAERANRFINTFAQMVEEVQKREAELRQQIHELKIEFDTEKRDTDVDNLIKSKFFKKLKEESDSLRQDRKKPE